MKNGPILLVLLLSAAIAWGTAQLALNAQNGAERLSSGQTAKESAYSRVMRTGTIRCGYMLYPKTIERDLNTGKMSGPMYEIIEEMGKQLSLKIEWTEEVGFANVFDGVNNGRYDVVCFPFGQTPGRARATEFMEPILYYPYFLYVREGDTRFDNAYEKVNNPSVKVAILEGEMSQTVKAEDFPKAQTVSMTALADINQVLLQVTTGKADAAMTEPSSSEEFMRKNPGKLRRVPGPSLRMQAGAFSVAVGEDSLRNLLNTTLASLRATGFIERAMRPYTSGPDQFYLSAPGWGEAVKPLKE